MLKAERSRRKLSLRAAAAEIGVGFSTVTRAEQGVPVDLASFLALAVWLQVNIGWFVGEDGIEKQDAYRRGWNDCAASVQSALRTGGDDDV